MRETGEVPAKSKLIYKFFLLGQHNGIEDMLPEHPGIEGGADVAGLKDR
jgi:hypothetical protein